MDFSEYTTFDAFYEEINSALNNSELDYVLKGMVEYLEEKEPEAPSLASLRTLLSAHNQLLASLKDMPNSDLFNEKLDQIYRETWHLVDQERWNHMEHKPLIFAVDDLEGELEAQHLAEIGDTKLECIFNTIRTTYPIGKSQRNALHHAILSDQVPMFIRATLLSAMTLNVLEWFDADLLECMYTYTLDDQPAQLRQQSWTALFLCGMVHNKRILHHPRLREEYLLLCEIEPSQLVQLQKLLLPLREYQSFSRDLHKLIEDMQQTSEEGEEQQTFEVTPSSENFKQFLDLMHTNVDTGYTQFKLMSKLGFFSMEGTDHHWLMPFDDGCEIIKNAIAEKPELAKWYQMLLHNQAQTNTDKYATFLIMTSMPQRVKDLTDKLSSLNLPEGSMVAIGADMIMQIHLQDLYRFFTLSKTGKTLTNPFKLSPDLSAYQCFGQAFHTAENLRTVADYLFKAERYQDAAHAYERLLELEITEQALKNAIYSMRNSSGHGLHKVRTLLILCNKLFPGDEAILKDLIMAFSYEDPLLEPFYKEALDYFPDDFSFLKDYGRYLNEARRYSEALNPLYKAFMINEHDDDIITEIATAHLRLGQKDKAYNMICHLQKPVYGQILLNDILHSN